ncbi:MFS transporter [Rossellomorea marisflavi]|jgi:MFS family permease|uniref:MDR family MFS transporter n=1 Tax=Rossellomorea marisflavi TaxID=189381 RepID=UPI0009A5DE21|nr:MFS transporter [Rossellomorea marisflavi]VXC59548.1 putative efflux transporter [Bacillus sp. 349Y]MDR4935864.1 MFS transporter [Rossellomorea marisflavi]MDW4527742.1 MFS transporter [Rossellomorea marisflavi]UTE74031.1 MFS transporter [Rossellomorea marisflavi]WJV19990.1 MFS transporter [Rossellomorea marisflavi]
MPRSLWLLIIGMMVNVTGSSFLWPLNTIYLHDHLGKTLSMAGIVLMLNAGASVAGNLIGGFLFDKMGGYRSILLGILITLTALGGMNLWHGWPHYVVFLTIVGFGSGIVFPSMYAMAGSVWPAGGRKAFNAVYVAQNIGVAVGASLGGLVASFSFNYIFLANFLMYIVFFLIALFGYKKISAQVSGHTSVIQESRPIRDRSKLTALLLICGAYLLCWVGYVQWQSTIASYTQEINISLKQYSFLWTINGALIVLAQPLLSRVIKRFENNLKIQIMIGTVIFMLSFAVAAFADQFMWFVAAMIILTVGEMLIWPAVPTIANSLAPKGREGFYQGIVNSTATGGRMIGPLIGGLMVDMFSMQILFVILIAFYIAAMILSSIYDRPLKRKEPVTISVH